MLRCSYPATASDVESVIVTVGSVLESLNHDLVQVGAWINVVGYISRVRSLSGSGPTNTRPFVLPLVDAVMIWSAGAIKLERYDATVRSYQQRLGPS